MAGAGKETAGTASGPSVWSTWEDPARSWCDFVAAVQIDNDPAKREAAVKVMFGLAKVSKWTHRELDLVDQHMMEQDMQIMWDSGSETETYEEDDEEDEDGMNG